MENRGSITLILGPMFSGKSTELLRKFRKHLITGKKCILIKPGIDDRYSKEEVVTHDQVSEQALTFKTMEEASKVTATADVVCIDEGQFFPDIVKEAEELANKGKKIYIAGLDGDYRRKGFGNFLDLLPLSEHYKKLSAICMYCKKRGAAFTHHKSAGKGATEGGELVDIGGADKYVSLCRTCWLEANLSDEDRKAAFEKSMKTESKHGISKI